MNASVLVGAALLGSVVSSAQASILVTYEDAGVQTTQVQSTATFDFNAQTPIDQDETTTISWDGVGTYTNASIDSNNEFGGAPQPDGSATEGSNYLRAYRDDNNQITLTLNEPRAYFGLWWSAMDGSNELSFYRNGELVAVFKSAQLTSQLSDAYLGKPSVTNNEGQPVNGSEHYAYVNFFGQNGTTWDQIVFRAPGANGDFESDNHAVRTAAVPPGEEPGTTLVVIPEPTVVPEPGFGALAIAGLGSFGLRCRRA